MIRFYTQAIAAAPPTNAIKALRRFRLFAWGSTTAPDRLGGLLRPFRLCQLLFLAALTCLTTAVRAQIEIGGPSATVQGTYMLPNNAPLPGFFTWGDTIYFSGSGWGANNTPTVHLVGPLNLPGVASQDYVLGKITADASGNLIPGIKTQLRIPGIQHISTQPTTPRPGQYILYATEPASSPLEFPISSFPNTINLSPRTIPYQAPSISDSIHWSLERGGRDGVIGDLSPERTDPEWLSVWDVEKHPVSFYATVADTLSDGAHQPVFISHEDIPWTHFGHDVNLLLVPDPQYAWILGDANYNTLDHNGNLDTTNIRYGRIEWEWETQNDGNPGVGHYGQGVIGFPLFAMPTTGDRIFTVGRWVMDNGHPDTGDRTEIHPARMIATIRKRNTAVPLAPSGVMTRATQVDIYVSGHGGGANMFPDGLDETLNRGTLGGGSLLWSPSQPVDLQTYFAWGPHDPGDPLLRAFAFYSGSFSPAGIQKNAGPSGVSWLNGADPRDINDMDYDFDVPLPAPPAGAVSINVQVTTQPQHSTSVQEAITYFGSDSAGRPTGAHIHLPYNGADDGIYARTLKFYWDVYNPPGEHFRVQLNDIILLLNSGMSGKTMIWADVCGQWAFLTPVNPNFLHGSTDTFVGLSGLAPFDVYLDPTDTLRVFTQGYDAEIVERFFGTNGVIGWHAYDAAIQLALASAFYTGPGDGNDIDLGGTLFQQTQSQFWPPGSFLPGHFPVTGAGYFNSDFSLTFVPGPPILSVTGVPVNLGTVDLGFTSSARVSINDAGESPLFITGVSVSGAGYTVATNSPVPGNGPMVVQIFFRPTSINQGAGTLTIQTNDPVHPSVTYPISAKVAYPIIHATANTSRTPSLVVGTTTTWPVTITNTGTAPLIVNPSITGAGFSIILPPGDINTDTHLPQITVPPGGTNTDLTVRFVTPFVQTKFVGVLTLKSNDPITPTPILTFGAEGVPVGMRVLVVQADGTPYAVVDHIHLKYTGKPNLNTLLTDVPLHTINPPESWKTIQYDYMTALAPTSGSDVYQLTVQVKNKQQTVTFTLAPDEFKQIQLTLP